MTRALDTAKIQQNSGGSVAPFIAGKNKIINGDFAINQRNFSSVTTNNTYGFDRWGFIVQGDGTATYSAQTFVAGTAPISGYEGINFARLLTSGQSSAAVVTFIWQKIEDVRTLAGQTATISFWAKSTSGTPQIRVQAYQDFGTGGSTGISVLGNIITLSTSWTRYSTTINIPSITGKTIGTNSLLRIGIFVSAGSNYSDFGLNIQNNTFDFWGVQVEAGTQATPFTTATGTIQGELAACQRYYQRISGTGSAPTVSINGVSWASTNSICLIQPSVTMRITPTVVDYSSLLITDMMNYNLTVSAVSIDTPTSNPNVVILAVTNSSGATVNRIAVLKGQSSSSYLGLSAEF